MTPPPDLPPPARKPRGRQAPTPPGQMGWSPPPGRPAVPVRGAGARPAPPPQPPAPTGTAENKRTRDNAPGRHTDRARRRQASTNRNGMGATPSMTRTTPVTPAVLPAQGRQRYGTRQSDLPPHWPPRPHKRGARRTGPPPPQTPPPGRGTPRTGRPSPRGAHNHKPGRGETRPGRPPPSTPNGATDRGRTRGGARTAWNGPTSAQRRDRAMCARHTNRGRGGDADAAGARAHTHTKGTRGIPEEQPDRARGTHRPRGMAYQRARVRDTRTGQPATHSAGHAGREGGNRGVTTPGTGPNPPEPAASAAHTRPGHCTRQGSSGALRHAPTRRLGSHRASPRGSHWQQASSTDLAGPAPRATTH